MDDPLAPDPREAKLPAWAREKLERLRSAVVSTERRLADAEQRLTIASGEGSADSNTHIDMGESMMGLGQDALVRFTVRDHSFDVHVSGEALSIDAFHRMRVEPVSRNEIRIHGSH
jgi:hypothetical protein